PSSSTQKRTAQRATSSTGCYLRAFTYFRSAELMLPPAHPRKAELYQQTITCFRTGLTSSSIPHEFVTVPWEGHSLSGTLFTPQGSEPGRRLPCVIFLSGADALPEQNYFRGVQWLTARGLACLIFNGPGQGGSIRLLNLPTLAEYERPVSAATDYLLTRDDIDGDRLGLMGVSMGGYYAMRAAAFEHRFRGIVVWGAMYSIYEDLWVHYPPLRPQLRWITGAKDDNEATAKLRNFSLDGLLEKVDTPVLITHGAEDEMVPLSAAQRCYEELRIDEKTLRIYTAGEGGERHINIDNWSQVVSYMVDWLADRLA
ncbi:MAG: alpha/beta hydrolase, partial [Proteobacteria bacterium]|nr:alpha/beta hydrolase [Pseudomonadota bacterium]